MSVFGHHGLKESLGDELVGTLSVIHKITTNASKNTMQCSPRVVEALLNARSLHQTIFFNSLFF